jgi:glycosyltransferase involved in cell wall biosynthesis
MNKKFILIDQSISSIAGHHYEYAMHVLEAAQRAGYTAVLATNRRFQPDVTGVPWKTYPIYKYGFWSAMEAPQLVGVARVQSLWRRLRFLGRCTFRFSALGMAWQTRMQLADFLLKQPLDRPHLQSSIALLPLVLAIKILRFLVLVLFLPLAFIGFVLRFLVRVARTGGYLEKYTRVLFGDIFGLSRIIRYFLQHRSRILSWFQQLRCLRQFTRDSRRLFDQLPPGDADVVFFPTISPVELMGLRRFLQGNRAASRASWHFLFRRNIYRGREGDYAKQDHAVGDLAVVFSTFQARLPGYRIHFYTDTEELTAQHNRLGVARFSTLPIPHTHQPLPNQERNSRPLRAIYIGDARQEKGYNVLPHIIQAIWTDCVETGKVQFFLQSNYNVPDGEPEAVIARSQLECLPSDKVVLLKTPLSSEQYRDLLLSGDINLLLYDRENYYARSSGILVESLAAAVPVLAPAGTWMARQFLSELTHHQERLRENMRLLKSCRANELRWMHGPNRPADIQAPIMTKVFTWIAVPPQTTHLLVTLWFGEGAREAILHLDQLDAGKLSLMNQHEWLAEVNQERKATVLIPIKPHAVKVWAAVSNLYAQTGVWLSGLRFDFLAPQDGQERPPIGAVGLIYQHLEEVPDLLRELIDRNDHYRATACRFAGEWRAYHNSDRLVHEIGQRARMEARP